MVLAKHPVFELAFHIFRSELNLAVAAHMSDRITDEVIETLSRCYKNLVCVLVRSYLVCNHH